MLELVLYGIKEPLMFKCMKIFQHSGVLDQWERCNVGAGPMKMKMLDISPFVFKHNTRYLSCSFLSFLSRRSPGWSEHSSPPCPHPAQATRGLWRQWRRLQRAPVSRQTSLRLEVWTTDAGGSRTFPKCTENCCLALETIRTMLTLSYTILYFISEIL